eukprot:gnl/TRDRNA2_/TRDRNA2_36929_c0_seq1.p1 gnl/TRDRNA2_/TRDRNA2_36929_c0~~gnl/TRDRNA2_/TRDRNA2_36929_c0_seq1.p1  ORF type:complete len:234 (+),score=31.64 gnl/TRDRNA2_/TRDRNA2_36929_c0_seq1:49-750(+)
MRRRRHLPGSWLAASCQLLLVACADGQGNSRCWAGHFNYNFCCNASFPEGNPDCWDKRRYTYARCCLSSDEPLPPATVVNPKAAKSWRVVCDKDLGGWMVHELVFYEDPACEQRIRKYARTIDSGHRKSFHPAHAFDQWVKATDEYFWYSAEAGKGEAWLGLELARHAEVRCVGLWHNNIPNVPVTLQRLDITSKNWTDVQHWPAALGGEWAMLSVAPQEDPASASSGSANEL